MKRNCCGDRQIRIRPAAYTDAGVVALGVAAFLEIPAVTFTKEIHLVEGETKVKWALPHCLQMVAST